MVEEVVSKKVFSSIHIKYYCTFTLCYSLFSLLYIFFLFIVPYPMLITRASQFLLINRLFD